MIRKRFTTFMLLIAMLSGLAFGTSAQAYHLSLDTADSADSVPSSYSLYESSTESDETTIDPDPTPLVQTVSYRIASGDTLYKIARDFDISMDLLLGFNEIGDPRALKVGQSLNIPSADAKINLPGANASISRVLTTTLTAYTSGKESTGKQPSDPAYGITYSGTKAEEGRTIAVDPAIIPIGATVYIDGIGIRTAEDTGSAIRGSRIDVYMDDLGQARIFGVKKNVKVFVLNTDKA